MEFFRNSNIIGPTNNADSSESFIKPRAYLALFITDGNIVLMSTFLSGRNVDAFFSVFLLYVICVYWFVPIAAYGRLYDKLK